jgi:PAS domain S-box-containing protein
MTVTIDQLKNNKDAFVVIADNNGIIVYSNDQAKASLGWESSDLVGKPLTTIIPQKLRDAHHLGFSRFLVSGKPTLLNKPLQLKVLSKDGRELNAEHLIIAENLGGKWFFGATIRVL